MRKIETNFWKDTLPKYFLLIITVAIAVLFGVLEPKFFSTKNIMDMLRTTSVVGCLSCGTMLLLQTGDTNFAVGSMATMAAAVYGNLLAGKNFNSLTLAFLITLAVMTVLSLGTSFLVLKAGIPTFICTLALRTVLDGVVKLLNNNTDLFSSNWPASYATIGQSFVFGVIPLPIVIYFGIALVTFIFMEFVPLGRRMFAAGANGTCARQVGIDVKKMKLLGFILCGFMCCCAGVLLTSIRNNVSVTMGQDLQMPALAAGMLGATFLKPGKYNVPGTFIAAFLMVMIQNGVLTAGGAFYTKYVVQGALLLVSVAIISFIREDGVPKVSFSQ